MIRAGDFVVIAVSVLIIVMLAAGLWQRGQARHVTVHGEHFHKDLPLAGKREVRVAGPLGETVIEIEQGRVRIAASPCAGKLCMRQGWLETAGAAAACVPNRVSVALRGADTRFDAVSF